MTKEQEKEYLSLLGLLRRVTSETKSLVASDNNRLTFATGLGLKFFRHSASIFYLSRGTIIKDFAVGEVNCIDFGSINAVARAVFEAFLTFHHVFAACQTDQVRYLRYWSWLLSGLCERQKAPAPAPEYQEKLEIERKDIKELHKKLGSNSEFIQLSKKQRANIMKGRWRLCSWKEMTRDAGLDEFHASTMYAYLCGYAHSDSLSVSQINYAMSRQQQQELCETPVGLAMIATASMIFLYCDVFPERKSVLTKNPKSTWIAKEWRDAGTEDVVELYRNP